MKKISRRLISWRELNLAMAIMLCITLFGFSSCRSGNNTETATDEEMNDDMAGKEEYGDADEWSYRVILTKRKIEPGTEHLGGSPFYLEGLTIVNHNGDYIAYNDEIDYQYYVTPFLFAAKLTSKAEFSSEKEWRWFETEVLDKTRYVATSAYLLDEIADKKWREEAKKLWYNEFKDKPIYIGDHGYGYQQFLYCAPFNNNGSLTFTIKRAAEGNEYGIPEGAVVMLKPMFGW